LLFRGLRYHWRGRLRFYWWHNRLNRQHRWLFWRHIHSMLIDRGLGRGLLLVRFRGSGCDDRRGFLNYGCLGRFHQRDHFLLQRRSNRL
jgi:hypothetical protein